MRVRAKGFTWLAGFASASLIIACQAADRVAPDKATSPTVEPATMQGLNVRPGEERFEKMAASVPAFAGYYYDEAGNLIIASADRSSEAQARTAARTVLRDLPPQHGKGTVIFRAVQYSFAQLAGWRDQISRDLLGTDGLLSVDADEVRNRVTLGVDNLARKTDLVGLIAKTSIPLGALVFEKTYVSVLENSITSNTSFSEPPAPGTQLSSYFEPVPGGVKISYQYPGLPSTQLG